MAWDTSDRRSRLPRDWQSRRLRILQRDGYACQWREHGARCLRPANQVDHITRGDDHGDANLQALCAPHHTAKTVAEATAARADGPPPRSRHREPEQHPGAYRP